MDAQRILRLHNPIKSYAWGSQTAIPELLGVPASTEPQAELWMGAHPSEPSRVETASGERALDAFVAADPAAILGAEVAVRYAGTLPFLMKVLAAGEPLSIQAHPSRAQARAGFARETETGIPLDSPERNYRDANHKPEVLCALTPFVALDRFRAPSEATDRMEVLGARDLRAALDALRAEDMGGFFHALMSLADEARKRVLTAARRAAEGSSDPALHWVERLAVAHPDDLGALAPLYLNLVTLEPGEAIYLPAGELHSYLSGTGIELMANSDNVLRGGLTRKHVDLPELMSTLSFEHGPVERLRAEEAAMGERRYETPVDEFALSVLEVGPLQGYESALERNVEILLCTRGACRLRDRAGESSLELRRGDSVLMPAALGGYRVEGDGVIYRAGVGGAAARKS